MDSGILFLSLLTSGIGMALFAYGKRAQRLPQLVAGALFTVYPYFVTTTTQMFVVGVLLTAGLWWALWMGF